MVINYAKFHAAEKLQLLESWIFFAGILHTFSTDQFLQKGVKNLSYFV